MTTSYPAALDSYTNPTATDETDDEIGTRTHSEFHADNNDAIEAIQAELGTDPSGASATVKARIAATETVANAAVDAATAAATYIAKAAATAEGATTTLATETVGAGHAPMTLVVDNSVSLTGSAQTFYDPTLFFGWNVTAGAARIDATKPAVHLSIEQDYWANVGFGSAWTHRSEIHLQYQGLTGNVRRVFSSQIQWTDDKVITGIIGDAFSVTTSAGTQLISWSDGSSTIDLGRNVVVTAAAPILAATATGGDAQVQIDASTGQSARFTFQVNHTTRWQLIATSGGNFQFYNPVSGVVALTLVNGAAPTTGRIEHALISKYTDAGLWQTTVGAAGAGSALPATPTKYLKVVDSAGTTLVIPAYAAS